jgi:SWI/SNF-related matrix-associated actin-dependent regulator of chromatin subfamily B protein 1
MKKQINAIFKSNTAPYKVMQEGEAIRIIKLNVRIGNIIIRDQFEWDINDPKNSPEVSNFQLAKCVGFCGMPLR